MSFAERCVHKLCRWLVRMAGDGGGRVSLGHLSVSGPGVPLGQWAVRDSDEEPTLRQLAEAIVGAASDDADGQAKGTAQQYVALFYPRETPEQASSRLPFRLTQAEQFAPEGSELATDPPNEKGLLHQAIRHNEFLVRTSFGAMGSAASQLERHNHMLGEQVAQLTEQVFKMQRERQDLLDRSTDRLLEVERLEAETKHREMVTHAMLSAGKGLLGVLANGGRPLQLPVSTVVAAQRSSQFSAQPSAPRPAQRPAPGSVTPPGAARRPPGPAPRGGKATRQDAEVQDAEVQDAEVQEAKREEAELEQLDASGLGAEPATVPAAAVLALDQLQDLFRSLTPEQIQTIAGVLSMEQQMAMMTLYYQLAGPDEDEDEGEPADGGAS